LSLAILAAPKQNSVPFPVFFVAVFALGALAVALVDSTVGMWYLGSLVAALAVGGFKVGGLKLGLPKKKETLVVGSLGALAMCIVGATILTVSLPMSTIEVYNLVLPLATPTAIDVWSFGVALFGSLIAAAMLLAYLVYIAFNEEIVFRGAVLSIVDGYLGHKYKLVGRAAAVLGMACAFAYFHFLVRGALFAWGPFLILTWLGIVWSITSLATGSIWPGVIAHALWNGLCFMQRGLILAAVVPLQSAAVIQAFSLCLAIFGVAILVTHLRPARARGAGRMPVLGRDGESAFNSGEIIG